MHRLAQYGIACERWVGVGTVLHDIMFTDLLLSRLQSSMTCRTGHMLKSFNQVVDVEMPDGLSSTPGSVCAGGKVQVQRQPCGSAGPAAKVAHRVRAGPHCQPGESFEQ